MWQKLFYSGCRARVEAHTRLGQRLLTLSNGAPQAPSNQLDTIRLKLDCQFISSHSEALKQKTHFFRAVVVSILLYECTTWTLTKCMEKKLQGNYTRIISAILNKSWRQHPTKKQLYGHLQPITKTIQVRQTRHTGHCWRRRDELISDILLWTSSHGRVKAGQPAKTYIQQLCADTGCSLEDLLEAMDDIEG